MASFKQDPVEDFLEVDDEIRGQAFACLSFLTPEKILKKKEVFKAGKFLEHIFTDESRPTQEIREKMSGGDKTQFSYEKINEMYEDWKYSRDQQLEDDFHKIQNFQTSIQGIKVRGVYATEQEARVRAKKLHQKDPKFHVFIAPVGYWVPYEVNPDQITDSEYQVEQLNNLAKEYNKNIEGKNEMFESLKREKLEKARKELEERKKKLSEETTVKTTTEEDIKNIETLRQIVDESDKKFYDSARKEAETASNSMSSLTEEDPWVQRKKQQQQSEEESA